MTIHRELAEACRRKAAEPKLFGNENTSLFCNERSPDVSSFWINWNPGATTIEANNHALICFMARDDVTTIKFWPSEVFGQKEAEDVVNAFKSAADPQNDKGLKFELSNTFNTKNLEKPHGGKICVPIATIELAGINDENIERHTAYIIGCIKTAYDMKQARQAVASPSTRPEADVL